MINGFGTALDEITLVLFTTLAPSSIFALMCVALYLLTVNTDAQRRQRVNKMLVLPLTASTVGLVASATHLGNPANALYVLLGVGRSPLSTEVFITVAFLMLAGLYWLYSFAKHTSQGLQRVWLGLILAAGVLAITVIAFAYNSRTIVSWFTVYVPLNLWLNALVGGSLLALLTLQAAGETHIATNRFTRVMLMVSGFALLGNTVSLVLQNLELPHIENAFVTAAELVPAYGMLIAVFFVLCAFGLGIYVASVRNARMPRLRWGITACALSLAGIFITRFAFYMMHMTVGLGV